MTSKLKEYFCYDCDGTFKVKHEMDGAKYPISNCVFCGSSLDTEDKYGTVEVEDFEDEL